ncbi:unnamed protein product [Urochloa humidicola]
MSVSLVTTSLLPPCRAIRAAASSSARALRPRAHRSPPSSSAGRAGLRCLAATPPPPEFPCQTPSEVPGTDRTPAEVPGTNLPPQEVPSIDTPPEFDAPPGVDDVPMPGAPGPGPELPGPAMPSPPVPEVPNVPPNPDVPPLQPPDVDPPRPPPEVVPPGATTVLPLLV